MKWPVMLDAARLLAVFLAVVLTLLGPLTVDQLLACAAGALMPLPPVR